MKETYAAPLYEGTFSVGLDKKFNRIDRDDPPARGALKLSLNPFLIHAPKRIYLFDVGIGPFVRETSATVAENLSNHGLSPDDITDIFASHLHYDHIGGLVKKSNDGWALQFPEAHVWVSKAGWKEIAQKDTYYDEEKTDFIHFLNEEANLQFVDTEDQPYPEITVREVGGHTAHSQVLLFENGDEKYLMAGDVLATRGEVNRNFAAKYDFDAEQSKKIRSELTQKAYDEEFTIMGYHESHHPLFKLTDYDENRGYTITNIDADGPA